jgi:hypothetical protein
MPEGKITMSAGRRRRRLVTQGDTAMSTQPHATTVAHHSMRPPSVFSTRGSTPDKTRYWLHLTRRDHACRNPRSCRGSFSIVQRRNGKDVTIVALHHD